MIKRHISSVPRGQEVLDTFVGLEHLMIALRPTRSAKIQPFLSSMTQGSKITYPPKNRSRTTAPLIKGTGGGSPAPLGEPREEGSRKPAVAMEIAVLAED